MLANFDQGIHPEAQHTGFYNDPDMMVIGMPGFTDAQNRVHMSLWAISGAPLLVGADLAKLSPETLAMLTNKEVLAVDQDALGLQAVKAAEPAKGLEVWVKPLAKAGSRAVLLLNRTGTAQEITAGWKDLGLAEDAQATVTNLWTGEQLARSGSYAVQVPPGDAVLLLVQGTEMQSTAYQPDPPTRNSANAPLMCRDCDLTFSKVASRRAVGTGPHHVQEFRQLAALCGTARKRPGPHQDRVSAHRSRAGIDQHHDSARSAQCQRPALLRVRRYTAAYRCDHGGLKRQ